MAENITNARGKKYTFGKCNDGKEVSSFIYMKKKRFNVRKTSPVGKRRYHRDLYGRPVAQGMADIA